MNSYFSLVYLGIFLPLVIVAYMILPQRHRWKLLLAAGYVFFFLFSKKLIIFLLFSTASIHHIGLWLSNLQSERDKRLAEVEKPERKALRLQYQRKQRGVLVVAVLLHLGILVALKYSFFLGSNANALLSLVHIPFKLPMPKFALPLGISFYTLQALSYLFDVYRGQIKADRNLGRLALYMSFFPLLMEGPICRYSDTAEQLWEGRPVTYRNLTFGFQRILFGVLKKMVIADRLNIFIKAVFNHYENYSGAVVAVAMVCYTCQLYMEFSGTMDVVLGTGEIFGVRIPENFRQPFFSRSISDFWTRWHITLGTWFRDYIFYPLSMSGPLKHLTLSARKKLGNHFGPLLAGSIALFAVWLANGVWHGAGWNYIFFGMYHFALILMGNIFEPLVQLVTGKLHINRKSVPYHVFQVLRTVLLVNIGELFFRANGLRAGLTMFSSMITKFSFKTFSDGSLLSLGLDWKDFLIVGITVGLILAVGVLRERGVQLRERIAQKPVALRWAVYYGMILFVIIFGAYGSGYVPVAPMYAGF